MLYSDLSTLEARGRLAEFISQIAEQSIVVERSAPLAGGASRDMWLVDLVRGDARERLVLRRDLPTEMVSSALSREHEFRLMQKAHDAGIRVARPRWLCADPQVLGTPFFLMDYVQGIAIGRKIVSAPELAHARAVLPEQMAAALAKIHSLSVDGLEFLPRPAADVSPVQDAIAQTYATVDALGVKNPTFEFALRWAERFAPAPNPIAVIHGDFRIGNLIVDPEGLAAVADWEFAHLGDPDEELGYLCMRDWRFGGPGRAGGIADRETFLHAYQSASGRVVDRRSVDFWEFLGNVRWGVICLSQAERHLSGLDVSVEFASLGRRSAEMQMEALRLIRTMEAG
ncbi:MAG: phosphotransferase family protein [Chloroflexi bacterium]|nr:phosphotransferase family protein [Chloroflexota bacterium]